ncbi:MAG: patatin-like phospholipase family protein [Candidatus Latescibacterota bacterium]|nr:MAG: patatin-like phospholipase family protein [Candidatus Latescibacterota bacterium]
MSKSTFRNTYGPILLVIVSIAFVSPVEAAGQRPRVGLALSGGAAKGMAHIGVIKVLEEAGIPIDVVTGCSMGSIIGGLYSVGYSTAEMETMVLEANWSDVFSDRVPRNRLGMEYKLWDSRFLISFPMKGLHIGLPSGLIAGQHMMRMMSSLTVPVQWSLDFNDLPIPFACVATDITTGEAVVLKSGFLADAIRASVAIPSIFTAVRIDDRLLVDGGLVRVMPAEDAIELGADIVIGVDVGEKPLSEEKLNSIIGVTQQTLTILMRPEMTRQRTLCDLVITPDFKGIEQYEFEQGPRLIELGEEAARAMMPQLEQLADSLERWGRTEPKEPPQRIDSFDFDEMIVEGLSVVSRDFVEREFGFDIPGRLTMDEIQKGVDQVYTTQFFKSVSYGIRYENSRTVLVLQVVEQTENLFRVGLRYDSRRKGELLLNTTIRNLSRMRATFALDIILAEEYEVDAKFFMRTGLIRALGFRLRANTQRINMGVFQGDTRVAQYITRYSFGEFLLGTIFSTKLNVAAGFRAEHIYQQLETGPPQLSDSTDVLVPFFGEISLDTIDRTVFPTHGLYVRLIGEVADRGVGSDLSFTRAYLDQRAALALHPNVSLFQSLFLGASNGSVPSSYLFFLGHVNEPIALQSVNSTFYGLEFQERAGPYVQMLLLGVQWQFVPTFFLQAGWNIGNTFEEWNTTLSTSRYINGGGLTLGANTVVGPIIFTIMTSDRHDILTYFSAGYTF